MEGRHVIVCNLAFFRGKASGSQNNCLIDTLRQLLNVVTNVAWVRSQLQLRFRQGPDLVTDRNFMTLMSHWGAAIDLLWEGDATGRPKASHCRYKIVCADLTYMGNGEVVGSGPIKLYVARENTNHFIPLLRRRA